MLMEVFDLFAAGLSVLSLLLLSAEGSVSACFSYVCDYALANLC